VRLSAFPHLFNRPSSSVGTHDCQASALVANAARGAVCDLDHYRRPRNRGRLWSTGDLRRAGRREHLWLAGPRALFSFHRGSVAADAWRCACMKPLNEQMGPLLRQWTGPLTEELARPPGLFVLGA